jgi:hypothetical protein
VTECRCDGVTASEHKGASLRSGCSMISAETLTLTLSLEGEGMERKRDGRMKA